MRANMMPGYRNGSSRRVLALTAALLAVVVLVVSGCSDATPVPPDVPPTFSATVDDQSYTVGQAITPLELPEATGGNGELSYSLEPAVAGLVFDPVARTLSGAPRTAGTYDMTYTVADADDNSDDTDTDTEEFTITVQEAPTGAECDDWNTRGFFRTATVEDVTSCIQAGADVNARDDAGRSPLHYAAQYSDDPTIVTVLVGAMAEVDGRSDDGETPLHRAAQFNGNPGIIIALADSGADLNARRNDGKTPLHHAARHQEDPEVVRMLLQAGADVNVTDEDGSTPLDDAQDPDIIAVLRAAGGECGEGRAFADDTCQTDTAPRFTGMVDDRTYTVGEAIEALRLLAATGGNGELRYSLEPTVPGLTFDPTERTLVGTPTAVGTYSMTYRVVDADENTGDNDAATLSFTITVGELVPPEYVGTWHFSGVPAPATVVFEQDRFMVTVGDGENGVVPTPPFDRIIRIMVSGTLAAQDSTLTMTVADDGVELTFAAGVTPAQQEALTQIVSDLVMQADDAPVSVVVEAGVITVTGGPIVALLLTTELTGMAESAPMFNGLVGDRSFTIDVPIAAVTLPSATGGNGTLTYSLVPEVPGLTFEETALTLSGAPTTPGVYDMTYRVVDDDTNTADTDADTQMFTITVREPEA